jgi:ribose 1,5-bisphosphate isomerase
MSSLPQPIVDLVHAIDNDTIGGAADMAKATAKSLEAIAAGVGVDEFGATLAQSIHAVLAVAPSITPVMRVLHEASAAAEAAPDNPRAAVRYAMGAFETWLRDALGTVASIGAGLVADNERMFIYSMSSPVYHVIETAIAQGKHVEVATTESRLGNEGLTTLSRLCLQGVKVTIGIDAGMVQLMRGCTSVWIGADAITSGGACLAKAGSYAGALTAQHYGIPFYVAGDTSKFDVASVRGVALRIREMPPTDVAQGPLPEHAFVRNPVFEVIPANLVTACVTELGVASPGSVFALMSGLQQSRRLVEQTAATAIAS